MQKSYSTKRLSLRRLARTDYQAWVASQELCKPKQGKFDIDPLPAKKRTRAFFNKAVAKHARLAKTDKAYVWNIFVKKTGELVGWVDLGTVSRDPHQMANLGYFLINIYRRKGYGQEAVKRIVRGAFEDLKFHRLEAVTDVDNKPSIAFALSCGLHSEGVKKHYWFQNGRWEDQRVFVITPELLK